MKLIIEKDYESMSRTTAMLIVQTIKNKPGALLCLAAGDTPRRAYSLIREIAEKENADLSQCSFVSLDEWVGIAPENEGSCQYFLRSVVFGPLQIAEQQIHLFNALSPDLENECKEMDRFISERGGIDLMVVGIGRNGHIGFNEPGVAPDHYSHVVPLDETTRTVGQKYFKTETVLSSGITLGLKHLMEAGIAIMIANGDNKAAVIKEALEMPVDVKMPASILQQHRNGIVILDEAAASLLTQPGAGNDSTL